MPKLIQGRMYMYNGENYIIKHIVRTTDGYLDIFTDKKKIRITPTEQREFLPVDAPVKANEDIVLYMKEQNKPLESLSTKLTGMIEKIETGTLDIKKAKAINETARSIIQLAKTQIDFVRVIRK